MTFATRHLCTHPNHRRRHSSTAGGLFPACLCSTDLMGQRIARRPGCGLIWYGTTDKSLIVVRESTRSIIRWSTTCHSYIYESQADCICVCVCGFWLRRLSICFWVILEFIYIYLYIMASDWGSCVRSLVIYICWWFGCDNLIGRWSSPLHQCVKTCSHAPWTPIPKTSWEAVVCVWRWWCGIIISGVATS